MRLERLVTAVAVALMGLSAGCGNEQNMAPDSRVDATYEALAGQFRACMSDAAACLKTANCNEAANQACRDQFATCRDAAKAAAEAFHDAVHQCRADARACWGDAGSTQDAGAARHACFDELKMCVASNRPEQAAPPPCVASLRDCIQADDADPHACLMTAHDCFMDSIPPRCDGDGGVVDGGWGFGPRGAGDHHGGFPGAGPGGGDHGGQFGGDHDGSGDHRGPNASSTDAGNTAGTGP
jgi:hypothetical protein